MDQRSPLTGYPSIDRPWMKYYSEEAIDEPLPECTMYEYIWENNKDHLDDVALVFFKKKITYREMFSMIDKTAKAFLSIGVKPGDVVTVLMLNQPEMVYVLYGLNKIGAVCCVVNVLSSEKELIHYLSEGRSKYFVALDVFFEKTYQAAKQYGVNKLIYVALWQSLGFMKNKLYRLKVKAPTCSDDFIISWSDFIKGGSTIDKVTPAKFERGKCTVIGHTGGTTGTPKGVMLTDYAFNSVFEQEKWMFEHQPNDSLMDITLKGHNSKLYLRRFHQNQHKAKTRSSIKFMDDLALCTADDQIVIPASLKKGLKAVFNSAQYGGKALLPQ